MTPLSEEDPAPGQSPLSIFLTAKEIALSGLAFLALAVLYFHDMVGGDFIFGGGDLISFFIPYRMLWLEQVGDFTFPLWNPYILSGNPLFATLQPAILYPLSLLFIAFPFVLAVNFTVVLHYALAGWFMYLLMRASHCGRGAALVSALIFMFGGYLVTVRIYLSTFMPVAWIPLLLLCFFAGLRKRDLCWGLAASVVGACMFLAGGVETCYQMFGLLTLFALWPQSLFPQESLPAWRWRLAYLGTFFAVFIGLIAVQFFPTYELSKLTERAGGLPIGEAARWSMMPQDLLQFFFLDPYGYLSQPDASGTNQVWLRSLYVGAIPFLLAGLALLRGGLRARVCAGVAVLSALVAMGPAGGLYPLFHAAVPFFDTFRYPVKFILPAVVMLALLAGWGWDGIVRDAGSTPTARIKRGPVWIGLATAGMVLFGLINAFEPAIQGAMQEAGLVPPTYNDVRINLFNSKRLLAFLSLFCLMLFFFLRTERKPRRWLGAALFVLALDLVFSGYGFHHKVPIEDFEATDPLTRFMQTHAGEERIYIADNAERAKDGGIARVNLRGNLIQGPKVPLPIRTVPGIYQADGWAVMRQNLYLKFRKILRVPPFENRLNLLRLANVQYIVSRDPLASPKLEPVEFHDPAYPELKVYKNTGFLPRGFLVGECRVVADEKHIIAKLLDGRNDFSRQVILEKPPEGFECTGDDNPETPSPRPVGSVADLVLDYGSVTLTATTPEPQVLVLSDAHYPGWKASIDGEDVPLYRANLVFRAVVVPAGTHQIRFEYRPWSFRLGAGITLVTIVLCGAFLLKPKRRHANTNAIPVTPS
ncbi:MULTISPECIES: YfhO family protein [unclassified Nitrospina]|uniref:YfhO family protein n=1 Tax=unclassified Nitrospina TaxID=2638683 RepID=UPI003F9A716B